MAATESRSASDPDAGRTFFDWTVDEPLDGATTDARPSAPVGGTSAIGSADYGAPLPPGSHDPGAERRVA